MTPERPTMIQSQELSPRGRWMPVILRVGGILLALVVVTYIANLLLTGGGPRESNRFVHPVGYSVIRPAGWEALPLFQPNEEVRDAINIVPVKWKGPEPTLWIRRLVAPPDLERLKANGYVLGKFAGREAWISQRQAKRDAIREAAFQVGDDWFAAGASLPGIEGARMEEWWNYLETFRPPPPRPAASAPATSAG